MVRALHERVPTAQELAAVGLSPDDFEEKTMYLWPENIPVFNMWQTLCDQWIMGFNGPIAINLIPVMHELDRKGIPSEDYDEWVADIKAMASAVLEAMPRE